MRTKIYSLFAIVVLIGSFSTIMAQQPQLDSKGTDFWLAFPRNIDFNRNNQVFFSISSDVATTGTWSIPGLGISDTFAITPGVVHNEPLPNSAQVTISDGVQNLGIHVTANDEVTVYGVNMREASTDAYLGLPSDILGKEYVVLGYQGNVFPSQMVIVGTADSTTVTITPSYTASGHTAGVDYAVTLDQGEVYQILAAGTSNDVSGTRVSADKNVAVFGGNQCVYVPNGVAACDHIIEQIPPVNTLGKSFVALPLARKQGSTFRVAASEDNTIVLKDGSIVANLNKGDFYEVIDSTQVIFEATKPVLVAQYCHGQLWDGVLSDPFMMLIPPYEQYLGSYTVSTPSNIRITDHFLNIIAPNSATNTVLLDGVLIPDTAFSPIGTSGFSGATRQVALGSHNVSSSSPIGIHSYGYGNADSYGYPGGQSLSEVASADSLSITVTSGTAPEGDTVCVVQATVLDSASNPLPGIRVDFTLAGANAQTGFAFTDSMGIATLCYYAANAGWDTVNAVTGGLNANGLVRILPCSLVLNANAQNILNGNPGSIDLSVSGNVSTPTYSWTGPNSFSASTQDLTGLTDSGTYKVVVSDPYFPNCKDSLEVNVAEVISPCTLGLSATKVDIINGTSGSIDLTVSGANGALSYMWTGPNSYSAATQDLSGLTDSGTYKVVVTDAGIPDCKDSISVYVTEVTAGGNCDLTCISDSSWRKSTVITQTNYSGNWSGVGGLLPGAASYSVMPTMGQPYPWKHINDVDQAEPISTESDITYFRKTFNLSTTSGIEARFRLNVDDQAEIYVNGNLVAANYQMGRLSYKNPYHDARFYGAGSVDNGQFGNDAYNYTTAMAMGSVFQVGANDVVLVVRNLGKPNDRGGFAFQMDLSGCGVIPKSANAESISDGGFELYPNPASSSVKLYLEDYDEANQPDISIVDLNGRVVDQSTASGQTVNLDVSDLAAGVYIVRVSALGMTFTQKLIKQ